MSEREQNDMTGVVETKLDALKESVDEFKGDVKTQLADIKGSVEGLRNESPIHRIETLEAWRTEVKEKVDAVPELKRWKANVNKWLATLLLGVLLAAASALFAVYTSR